MQILLLEPNDDIRAIATMLTAEGWEATAVEDAGIVDNPGTLTTLLTGKEFDYCLCCTGGQPVLQATPDRLLPLAKVACAHTPLRAFVVTRPGPVPAWPFSR